MLRRLCGSSWLLFCGIFVILAGLSRFLFLDDKPYHHDESLHAYYSNRVAQGFPHEYSALLHGPVLYYLTGIFMRFFGADDFTARLPAAICGVLIALVPLFWRKRIGTVAAAAIALFILMSPTLMYFGRFLREDAFNSLWICISLACFFAYRWTGKPAMSIGCSAFLAMQFCNKENSYLHMFIWLSGAAAISFLSRQKDLAADVWKSNVPTSPSSSVSDKMALWVNCIVVFSVIFVLFYSSFFRHSKGAMHGILDGLYRESLLYWWEQNQKRRIDGPFDYHSPLVFNYEFALIPALIAAWYRSVRLSALTLAHSAVRFPYSFLKKFRAVIVFAVALLGLVLFFPRIGLTPDGCSFSELCLKGLAPEGLANLADKLAHLLHIAHTRHLLQIIAVALLGAIAVVASVNLGRRLDAFLWWWATGAIGAYSYVGEKVPWLLIYILLPLIVLAGFEMGRSLSKDSPWIDTFYEFRSADVRQLLENWEQRWKRRAGRVLTVLTVLLLAFAGWKAVRLSFMRPSDPLERLVFTQTTPTPAEVRERWLGVAKIANQTPKVTMFGEATWPMAWYVQGFPGHDFTKPPTAAAASAFDAIFLDTTELSYARDQLTAFDVYKIPLRHWWVPKPNPSLTEILEYFLTSQPYPRELRQSPQEMGFGQTEVLYLENRSQGRLFESTDRFNGGQLLAQAGRSSVPASDSTQEQPSAPVERNE